MRIPISRQRRGTRDRRFSRRVRAPHKPRHPRRPINKQRLAKVDRPVRQAPAPDHTTRVRAAASCRLHPGLQRERHQTAGKQRRRASLRHLHKRPVGVVSEPGRGCRRLDRTVIPQRQARPRPQEQRPRRPRQELRSRMRVARRRISELRRIRLPQPPIRQRRIAKHQTRIGRSRQRRRRPQHPSTQHRDEKSGPAATPPRASTQTSEQTPEHVPTVAKRHTRSPLTTATATGVRS